MTFSQVEKKSKAESRNCIKGQAMARSLSLTLFLLTFGQCPFIFGCKPGSLRSSNHLKVSPDESKKNEAARNSGDQKEVIVANGFLFSISPKASPAEKCWYVAKGWGQPGAKEVDLKSGKDLQTLTKKSVTSKYVQTELNKQESEDLNWRNGARMVIAGCTAVAPLAATNPLGALFVAICGVGGTYTERDSNEKVTNSGKAEKIATVDTQKPDALAAAAEFGEKAVVDVFVKALKGKPGDGKADCATSLKNATLQL